MTFSVGSLLVGASVILITVAYVIRPFRRREMDLDRAVDAWVRQIEAGEAAQAGTAPQPPAAQAATASNEGDVVTSAHPSVNFCPYCGRRVESDHRFCPSCGKPLPEDAAT